MKTLFIIPTFLVVIASSHAAPVDFTKDVQPILAKSCGSCHGGQKSKGGVKLDSLESITKNGTVVFGSSNKSSLFQSLTGDSGVSKMPPKGPGLTANEINTIKSWIDQDAKGPAVVANNNVKPMANVKPAVPAAARTKKQMERERERAKEEAEKARERAKEKKEKDD
jgi:mono/diheme cytochrome c family protein